MRSFTNVSKLIVKTILFLTIYIFFVYTFLYTDLTISFADAVVVSDISLFESVLYCVTFSVILFLVLNPSFILKGNWFKSKLFSGFSFTPTLKDKIGVKILAASALSLFLELSIIRIHSSYFPLLGFFKNLSLLSCFLGLGLGFMLSKKYLKNIILFIPMLSLQIIFLDILSSSPTSYLLKNPIPANTTMGVPAVNSIPALFYVYLFLVIIFVFNALLFVPLGQLISFLMSKKPNLKSYSLNLVGSVLGICVFLLFSYLWTSPIVWLLLSISFLLYLLTENKKSFLASVLFFSLAAFIMFFPSNTNRVQIFSPYQDIVVQVYPKYTSVATNGYFLQRMVDLSANSSLKNLELFSSWSDHYKFPYLIKSNPENVLIVGSGTGNDISSAIRNHALNVDSVEIDPVIVQIGEKMHPEQPFNNKIINTYIEDARSFIKKTNKKYDLIIYGYLDSHITISNAASVRLDSYVYTVEAFEETRKVLKDDGALVLSFAGDAAIFKKFYFMLKTAFPDMYTRVYAINDFVTFVVSKDTKRLDYVEKLYPNVTSFLSESPLQVDLATDDWPFLYMSQKHIPLSVISFLLLLLYVSFLMISSTLNNDYFAFNKTAFFLGAAFMLVETKAITELALYFGSTWQVIGITSASALLLALMANVFLQKKIIKIFNVVPWYIFLVSSVVVGYLFSNSISSLPLDYSQIGLLAAAILTLPIFFSGLVFSNELKYSKSVGSIMASNLLGVMFGGMLEYSSMRFGYSALYLLAIILYLLAFIFSNNKLRS